MTSHDKLKFKQLLASCRPSKPREEKAMILMQALAEWERLEAASIAVEDVLLECGLFGIYADVFEDYFSLWQNDFPDFWDAIRYYTFSNRQAFDLFPREQIAALVTVFKKYIMVECWDCMSFFYLLPLSDIAKEILFEDSQLYDILKVKIDREDYLAYFISITYKSDAWQQRILKDEEFLVGELNIENPNTWALLNNLSIHPEAKVLLPRGLILAAASKSLQYSNTVRALLSDDNDLKVLAIEPSWLEETGQLLGTLLATGKAERGSGITEALLELVLPIANLSVVECHKAFLGEKSIPGLMQLITAEKLPESPDIYDVLRARQEASRALWNLGYEKSNLPLIAKNDGLYRLKAAMERYSDPIIKKNIAGILFMFNGTSLEPQSDNSEGASGHVMISYNWGNQPIVKRISQSLKDLGYKVWLDVEQMEGSTLEAMSGAIEQAEMLLLCMSQQYKDSPNCRLEGEYCVNRRLPFAPLMMQRNYKPDGWLGITLGAKLWYDFTDESNWGNKIATLAKAIGDKGKKNTPKLVSPDITAKVKAKSVYDWTTDDVLEWMKSKRIDKYFAVFQQHDMDGMALVALKQMQQPQLIFGVCEKMGIVEMGGVLRIAHAVQNLQLD